EQGKVEIKSLDYNLQEFVEDVIDEMDGMLKKKSQRITYLFKGETNVYQDKKILRNVLLNLISNAIKYSPENREIQVVVTVNKGQCLVSIKDEGIGIPQESQHKLFDKFFRADNAINIQGTGLGLNIVKRYMELLDGRIDFVSQENRGTTFTISFPQKAKESL
ncbi:MAG: sensor histidine kinase, partial [Flavisolibacter sp.]